MLKTPAPTKILLITKLVILGVLLSRRMYQYYEKNMNIHAAVKANTVSDTSTNQNTSNCEAAVKVKNVADSSSNQNTFKCKGECTNTTR
ncbi:hypothetical protein SUGI_0574950 [Cryptomeria japonica]|nr:hypothetical protein SUGI_0574950 [Cryptomeria japonica]